jgi:nucleolar protein 12
MGIFDGIFGGEPRASSGASALFDARSAFHAASAADAPVVRAPLSASAKKRARRDASADATDARAKRAREKPNARAASASSSSSDAASSDDEGESDDDGDSDSDEGATKAKPSGSGYRDRSAEATAEELARTVFVGNVPAKTKLKKLKAKFGEHGKVVSVRLRNVPVEADGNEPRKIKVLKGKLNAERANATAFVVYDDAASARAATAALNMKEFEGRHIRVDLASKPSIIRSEVVYDHTRSVFLGHLPFNVDDEDVIRLFNKNKEYPDLRKSVEAVRVVRDRKTTMGKGIGFVLFKTPAQARTALLLDGSKLGDREIRVSKAARSKAPKPGTPSKARAEPKVATGAERRNPKLRDEGGDASTSRGTNAWEGSRSRPGGKSSKSAHRGGEAQRGAPGARQTSSKAGIAKAAKRSGKRPAVAARKAKAKASAAAGRN